MELLKYTNLMKEILETQITSKYELENIIDDLIKTMSKMDPRIKDCLTKAHSTIYYTLSHDIEKDGFIYYKDMLDHVENTLKNYAIDTKRKMQNGTS